MGRISEWQYPLYKESDEKAYGILAGLAKTKKAPCLIGTKKEINAFLKFLVVSQKIKGYRRFRDIVLPELKKEKADIPKLLEAARHIKIPRGIDKSWAVFRQDKRICELIDQFNDAEIEFVGSNAETVEFVARFLLSQLLQDWRGPKMAVVLECLMDRKIKLPKLNKLLGIWDYTKLFAR